MPGIETLAIITGLLLAAWFVEARRHLRRLARVPIRIHVNGTRGKSSVTRLIAAGLRAGGVVTCAKVTGTQARVILPTGEELPVFRPARANVLEQKRVVQAAADLGAQALVIECMALQPELQWLCERWFVRATHGVITNARPDHLDVMGPTPDDVARALAGMIPPGQRLYTCERARLGILAFAARDRGAELVALGDAEAAAVSAEDLRGFSYVEHPDNVALALRVCTDVGVARAAALAGMWAAAPDSGAMREYRIRRGDQPLLIVNGFAANDPESTRTIWDMAVERHPEQGHRVALFNARHDRADRSRQLGEVIAGWPGVTRVVAMGTATAIFWRAARAAGLGADRIVDLEGADVPAVLAALAGLAGPEGALVVGVGNIGGPGLELVEALETEDPS